MSRLRNLSKLYVNNLSWTISSRELKRYFAGYGHVANATVVFNKETGMSRCFGFVTFSSPGGIDAIMNSKYHVLGGQHIVVQPSA